MRVGIPTEIKNNEFRVAITPAGVAELTRRGHEVIVLRILDPAEVEFRFETPGMFLDLESGRELCSSVSATSSNWPATGWIV